MRLREFHGELKYEFDAADVEELLREEIGLPALSGYTQISYTFVKLEGEEVLSLDRIEVVVTSWEAPRDDEDENKEDRRT